MKMYRFGGDADYIGIAFDSVEEVTPLRQIEFERTTIDPAHVVNIHYTFHEPDEDGVVTDCPYSGVGSTLVLSQRACKALGPMLDRAGALLRLNPAHEMGHRLFVWYRHIDALDTVRTKREEGFPSFITRHEFQSTMLEGVDIFRLSNRIGRLFVSERFVQEVRRHRLSGFRFRHIWSSDQGGVALADPVMIYERFPQGYGTTLREKRRAMRDLIVSGR